MEELEKRGKNIRVVARAEVIPDNSHLLPKKQRGALVEWCDQVGACSRV